eukprot:TRINITY_DN2279_c0_g1_i3.p1 TRINITY_DN2279_c0_g1~~TRINITY_DN2279_c0_g1_i3.p1  ORF type:complete len:932 (+),score=233.54 TRINITY_DN2279_c0_g1_i3:5-2800(+)
MSGTADPEAGTGAAAGPDRPDIELKEIKRSPLQLEVQTEPANIGSPATLSTPYAPRLAKTQTLDMRNTPPPALLRTGTWAAALQTLQQHDKTAAWISNQRLQVPKVVRRLAKALRRAFYRELLIFTSFLVLFLMIVVYRYHVFSAFEASSVWKARLQDQSYFSSSDGVAADLSGISSEVEWWEFVKGPLLSEVWPDSLPNGSPIVDETDADFVSDQNNRLLGSVQFRQVRVHRADCTTTERLSQTFDKRNCYPYFSADFESKRAYGPNQIYKHSSNHSILMSGNLFGDYHVGWVSSYGRGGFDVEIPSGNSTLARIMIDELIANKWMGLQTRAVAVTFNTYNQATDLVTQIQILLERSPSANLVLTLRVSSVRMYPYISVGDYIRAIFELIFLFILIGYTTKEMWQARRTGFVRYYQVGWNWLELLNLVFFWVSTFMWFAFMGNKQRAHFNPTVPKFTDLGDVMQLFTHMNNVTSLCVVLSFVKIFKFLRLNTRMSLLWRTLTKAAPDLFSFLFITCIVFIGFVLMAYIVFGPRVRGFHSIVASVSSCARMMLGDFDYQALSEAAPQMGPIFFTSFIITFMFVLLNMFIAIIQHFYELVQENAKKELAQGRSDVEYDFFTIIKRTYTITTLTFHDKSVRLKHGQTFTLYSKRQIGDEHGVSVSYKRFDRLVHEGTVLLLGETIDENGDTFLELIVKDVKPGKVECIVNLAQPKTAQTASVVLVSEFTPILISNMSLGKFLFLRARFAVQDFFEKRRKQTNQLLAAGLAGKDFKKSGSQPSRQLQLTDQELFALLRNLLKTGVTEIDLEDLCDLISPSLTMMVLPNPISATEIQLVGLGIMTKYMKDLISKDQGGGTVRDIRLSRMEASGSMYSSPEPILASLAVPDSPRADPSALREVVDVVSHLRQEIRDLRHIIERMSHQPSPAPSTQS